MILCNNLNYQHSPRCMEPIAEMHQTVDGFHGTLTNGIEWEQKIITPYIHEFRMENVHYYVVNGQIVYAN